MRPFAALLKPTFLHTIPSVLILGLSGGAAALCEGRGRQKASGVSLWCPHLVKPPLNSRVSVLPGDLHPCIARHPYCVAELPAHPGPHASQLHATECLTSRAQSPTVPTTLSTPAGTHEADTHPHPHIFLASVPPFHHSTCFLEYKPSTSQFLQAIYSLLESLWSNVLTGHHDHNTDPLRLMIQMLSLMWMSLSRSQVPISNQKHEKFKKKTYFSWYFSSDANSLQPMVATRSHVCMALPSSLMH